MPHRIRHAGTDLSAWCAWDPLFLALVIGDLQVATADPVTGETITYRADADGSITGASHPAAVLSFRRPDQPWGDDAVTTFCHYVLHFTGPATAQRWTAAHPGTLVIKPRPRGRAGQPPRHPGLRRRVCVTSRGRPRPDARERRYLGIKWTIDDQLRPSGHITPGSTRPAPSSESGARPRRTAERARAP